MIKGVQYDEYKTFYYRTNTTKEEFYKLAKEYLCEQRNYECDSTVHTSGVFFKRKKLCPIGLLCNCVEIIFTQRNNYSIMSVSYHITSFAKYFRFIAIAALIALIFALQAMGVGNRTINIFNLALTVILLFKDVIVWLIYRMESKDIGYFIDRGLDSAAKIKFLEYNNLLNDDFVSEQVS